MLALLTLALSVVLGTQFRVADPPAPGATASAPAPSLVCPAVAAPGLSLRKVERSFAVYPKQEIPLKFSHRRHLKAGMNCVSCHEKAKTSDKVSDRLLPAGRSCDNCHGAQHPPPPKAKRQCAMCHQVDRLGLVSKTVTHEPARLRFSHRAHRDSDCSRCHGDLGQVDLATREHLPTEANCLSCHDGKKQSNACQLCHPRSGAGRLKIASNRARGVQALVPRGDRRGALAHDLRFVYDHAAIATAQRSTCMGCHAERFCSDCHGQGTRPMQIHPAGYLGTHGIGASFNSDSCMSCHQRATDCRACHLRFGISDRRSLLTPQADAPKSLRFHPPNYATLAGPQVHAADARTNIAACASCHSEDTCLACHATTQVARPGLSANPHGANFVASGRCSSLSKHNRRTCLKCHAPGVAELECVSHSSAVGWTR